MQPLDARLKELFEMAADPDNAYHVQALIDSAKGAFAAELLMLERHWGALCDALVPGDYSRGKGAAFQECIYDIRKLVGKEPGEESPENGQG